jgi:hypothetical protein
MKLNPGDRIWCPVDSPDYLCVMEAQRPPANPSHFLSLQQDLLERLCNDRVRPDCGAG